MRKIFKKILTVLGIIAVIVVAAEETNLKLSVLSYWLSLYIEDNSTESGFGTTVSSIETVSNEALSFKLHFMDEVQLPNGNAVEWSAEYKKPYIDAAKRWLTILKGVDGKDKHTIIMEITVNVLNDGNGAAGPSDEEKVGNFLIPTKGELIVGNHTYVKGFDQAEFKANIFHEIGHIIGMGAYTTEFTTFDKSTNGNVFRGVESNKGVEYYNAIYGTSVDFVPISDDKGHLYDYVMQEDKKRTFADGSELPPLTKELMANGTTLGAVTFGVLDDIGYKVDYSKVEFYTP